MSTHRNGRIIIFACDLCDSEIDTGETNFADAIQIKKDENWGSRKDENGEWMDICSDCKVTG